MPTTRVTRRRAPAYTPPTPGNEALDHYLRDLNALPMLTRAEETVVARRMRDPSLSPTERAEAREQLIRSNLRFAFATAKKYQNRGLPLEDLVGEANAGLCHAVDKFDPNLDIKFISYAVWWIKQGLLSAIARTGRTVRVPLNRTGDLARVMKAYAALSQTLQRRPTQEEVSEITGLTPPVVGELLVLAYTAMSFDEPLGNEDGGRTAGDVLRVSAGFGDTTVELDEAAQQAEIRYLLNFLPERDRKVLMLYYGIEGGTELTLEEIGQRLGVTRERIRQLRDRGIGRIRAMLVAKSAERRGVA
jgi:RNA polymerase primary sigma factor